jgi:site-specific DNA-methyltransferase (adenine-specific)
MIFARPEDIVIPDNRFRREFDERKLGELRDSILRVGLIHFPTVEKQGDKYTLRSGERRLRVLSGLVKEGRSFVAAGVPVPPHLVPLADWAELTELQRIEVEVEENVIRTDFSWQERSQALTRLHELRKRQNPEQSLTATATEVVGKPAAGSQVTAISDALLITKHLANPEVAKARNSKEALKVIRRIAEAKHLEVVARTYDLSKSPHKLLKGDAQELLETLPDRSFDVIITDPPYGLGADNFGSMAGTAHEYEDSYKHWKEILSWLPDQLDRVAKERAHCYIFCDPRRFEELATFMLLSNWQPYPVPLIWSKGNGMLPYPDHGPRRTYETIMYAWRGDRRTLVVKNDVVHISGVRNLLHGAQKPVALYQDLLSRSARPGDSVLDCFGGSGPVLVAANRMRLVATYIERDDKAFNVAVSRVNTKDVDDGAVEEDGLEDVAV